MPVLGLEHINIRTADLARTLAFFGEVLGMKVGPSPGSGSTENGAWIFDTTGKAVIHVASSKVIYPSDSHFPFERSAGSGTLHHVALKCSGFEETLARVQALGMKFYLNDMPQRKLRQIFVHDANESLFELNCARE